MTLSLPESAQVSIHTHCTFFLLKKYLACVLPTVFVGILFCKAKEPGHLSLTPGLVFRCSYCRDPISVSGWEHNPHSNWFQVEATHDQLYFLIYFQISEQPQAGICQFSFFPLEKWQNKQALIYRFMINKWKRNNPYICLLEHTLKSHWQNSTSKRKTCLDIFWERIL